MDVLASAIEYGLDELRRLCILYLVESLSGNTACEALQAAVTYGQDDLKHKAMIYIEKHTKVSVKRLDKMTVYTVSSRDSIREYSM